ncbi:family 16 glycosylhydrolase [Polaribacter sp. Z014]|uniref:family 16 glycosylhydrolase n=1 Tax=Polaribacter sp. Z014 TaxID=2927126 RepID=UPI0020220CB0|nr:family 16 glycosylhydrolase [Polaribacter sp. Z014]MCL7765074.1 family 16 glycosylhydrolase [Polaribacter sp. Z014]
MKFKTSIKGFSFILLHLITVSCASSQDAGLDVELDVKVDKIKNILDNNRPESNEYWEYLKDFSDEFNYVGKNTDFQSKWKDTYFNGWKGPGLTEWTTNNSDIKDGNLVISASRKPGTNKVYCGVISSKKQIIYPIYTEVRAKIANQVLSSNFWFLSDDDKRELDILECYGGDREDEKWFASNASSNTHVFVRNEQTNTIIKDINKQDHHNNEEGKPWREEFHTYGAFWKDANTIDIYYDGKLVSEIRKEQIQDPENLGLDREMFLIIDLEDHDWRSSQNPPITPTDAELSDQSKNKYLVDYVRTFRPIIK